MVGIHQTTHPAQAQPALWSGKVALIAKPGGVNTGVGRYVRMLQGGLCDAGVDVIRVAPTVPPLPSAGYAMLRRLGMDLRAFLTNYPIWAKYPRADVYHLTSQNLASLLLFRRPAGRIVVTVHDIIPYMLRDDPQLSSYRTAADRVFDRLAMIGLKRADRLIADSQYTKRCVVDHLGISQEQIEVIYLGIDHERYRPLLVPAAIREHYRLPEGRHYLIYVGSEDPRKNLVTLVRALAELHRERQDVELIKVGRAHFDAERQKLIELADKLGVRTAIHFLDEVPEDDLPLLYNLADVCVMPSLYEGFGFPVVEAMACGTPVVCSTAPALTELAENIALQHGAIDATMLTTHLCRVLSKPRWTHESLQRSMERATNFSWSRTIEQTLAVYQQALCS